MKTLALTGGIAGGKTTVCGYFEKCGAVVLNADQEAHESYAPGTPLFEKLQERFGQGIVNAGRIDRRRLGEIVFASQAEMKWLESETHPWTRSRITEKLTEISKKNPPLVLVEAALHVETGYYREFDGLIVVYAPEPLALQRLMARDKINEAQARLRMASQMPIEKKKKLADWIIDNSGSMEETKNQVEELFKKILAYSPQKKG